LDSDKGEGDRLQGRRDESLITENGHQRLLQATVRFYLQYSSQFELDRCLKRRAEEVDDERVRERSAGGAPTPAAASTLPLGIRFIVGQSRKDVSRARAGERVGSGFR
jgi:hypothetical protein